MVRAVSIHPKPALEGRRRLAPGATRGLRRDILPRPGGAAEQSLSGALPGREGVHPRQPGVALRLPPANFRCPSGANQVPGLPGQTTLSL
jgi:hypothetical protein